MRVGLLQMHSIAGQIDWNARKILESLRAAQKSNVDLIVTPELALMGYPGYDLLTQRWILEKEAAALKMLAAATQEYRVALLVGHTTPATDNWFWNAASFFENGSLRGCIKKERIPSYNVFSEARHFIAFTEPQPLIVFQGCRLGVSICEDDWDEVEAYGPSFSRKYPGPTPLFGDDRKNCDLHINLSASPFEWSKKNRREKTFTSLSTRLGKPFLWVNRVGGQDEILFDGQSAIVDGLRRSYGKAFAEDLLVWDSDETSGQSSETTSGNENSWSTLANALTMGIRDFVRQSGASQVLLGLSGGIDSACVAMLAAKAVGPENVFGISLPSAITSENSKDLARRQAALLGISYSETSIRPVVEAASCQLNFNGPSLAQENLQSRARGLLLMGEANQTGRLLLCCTNKSEMAMGYGTMYGDLTGALAPIGDLFKSQVYGLCHYANHRSEVILSEILTREPTAELALGQTDLDSLPPYPILDTFLDEILNYQGKNISSPDWQLLLAPFTTETLIKKLRRAEFKRYQAPPVLRVQNRSFGRSWQMPIAYQQP